MKVSKFFIFLVISLNVYGEQPKVADQKNEKSNKESKEEKETNIENEQQGEDFLTLAAVINSSLKHSPIVLESLQDVEASKAKAKEMLGGFDSKLKNKSDKRFDGYYDGKSTDFVIEKPLQYLNSKIYSGYRVSEGEYPDYEGKRDTLDNGEIRAGVQFSLWRNALIDKKRLKLWNSQIDVGKKENKLSEKIIKLQKEATKHYWKWVAKGKIYKVYQELLEIALKRDKALRRRIKKGDLARIYATENQQYIVKWRTQVIQSEREFLEASVLLSLFLRDENSSPMIPSMNLLPTKFTSVSKIELDQLVKDIDRAKSENPKFKNFDLKLSQLKNEERLAEQSLNPRFDFNFEIAKDRGTRNVGRSAKTLKGEDQRAMLMLEIPIERNLGRGAVQKTRAKQRVVQYQKKFFVENIEALTKSFFYRINASVETIKNSSQEVQFASELQKAEVQKFNSGASDFFVVNLRETNMANAKVKLIKAHYDYYEAKAEYDQITLSFATSLEN